MTMSRSSLSRAILGCLLICALLVALLPGAVWAEPERDDGVWYVVRRGDTLSQIAVRHNTTTAAIALANGLRNPNMVRIGQRLWIPTSSTPGPAPAPSATPAGGATPAPSGGTWYVVRRGDILGTIAVRFHTTTYAIAQANHLRNRHVIYVGQRLWIPGGTGSEPQPTPVPGTTPQPTPAPATGGGSFGYGFQIDPWSGDLGLAVNATRGAGFGWVKIQLPWREIERDHKGDFKWSAADGVVDQISGSGLNLLLSVVKAPNWARKGESDLRVDGPPANAQDIADFLGAVAGRYKGKVKAIEVWNEQNLGREWGNEPLDAGRYVDMLCRSYRAIKAADPQMLVISGAPTPTGWNDGRMAIDDVVYVAQMYQRGCKACMDGLGAHPSGYNNPPDARYGYSNPQEPEFKGHSSFFFQETMLRYRNIMLASGDSHKRIWPTEFGWASATSPSAGYEYARDVTYEEQAQYLVRAYQMMKQWGWVGPALAWNLNFGLTAPGTEMAQFAIYGRPAYDALKNMAK